MKTILNSLTDFRILDFGWSSKGKIGINIKEIKDYSWHHSHKYGIMQLVERDLHKSTAHTGGRNFWGGGTEKRK